MLIFMTILKHKIKLKFEFKQNICEIGAVTCKMTGFHSFGKN
jgi:hypothetical protein